MHFGTSDNTIQPYQDRASFGSVSRSFVSLDYYAKFLHKTKQKLVLEKTFWLSVNKCAGFILGKLLSLFTYRLYLEFERVETQLFLL